VSATARRGIGKRWDTAATPAVPDVPIRTKSKAKPKAQPQPPVEVSDGSAESLRKRLARLALDVHDGPMQNLAVIGFSLGDMRRRMRSLVPVEHHGNLDSGMEQISAELGRVESELRALITALEHNVIKTVPLIEAIEMEIREFERNHGVKVDFFFDGQARAETDSQRIALQSVTRAALANIGKHAEATKVEIRLSGSPDSVKLEIEDNGRGFSPDTPNPGRFGLTGMRERVELLGGVFHVRSRPGGPTKISAQLHPWRPVDE
jgi:signal transduction histidine kinase